MRVPVVGEKHETEAARVVEHDTRISAVRGNKVENYVVVCGELGSFVVEDARRLLLVLIFNPEGTGHAQMADKEGSPFDLGNEILCASTKRDDPPALQTVCEAGWK